MYVRTCVCTIYMYMYAYAICIDIRTYTCVNCAFGDCLTYLGLICKYIHTYNVHTIYMYTYTVYTFVGGNAACTRRLTMRCVYLHTCLAIPQTITWCKAYQNVVLNGKRPLKLHVLHLYAIVVTTSNKLVTEPRQACTYEPVISGLDWTGLD